MTTPLPSPQPPTSPQPQPQNNQSPLKSTSTSLNAIPTSVPFPSLPPAHSPLPFHLGRIQRRNNLGQRIHPPNWVRPRLLPSSPLRRPRRPPPRYSLHNPLSPHYHLSCQTSSIPPRTPDRRPRIPYSGL